MTEAARLVLLHVSRISDRPSRQELAALRAYVDALLAPCFAEPDRQAHEEAAIAALIVDDDMTRIAALDALFMHGSIGSLPMLRQLSAEASLAAAVRAAAATALASVLSRSPAPGAVSAITETPGSLSR
jgi:hypothetical protein